MSASATFTYEYKISIVNPTPSQDFFNITTGVDRSGTGNSVVVVGDGELNVELGDTLFKDGTEFTYEGRTADGIVIKDLDGDYLLLTNGLKTQNQQGEIGPLVYCLLSGTEEVSELKNWFRATWSYLKMVRSYRFVG